MTATTKHRLSPSGPFIGDPGLQAGPGSIGLVWRQHGTTSLTPIPSSTPTAIPGLGGTTIFGVNLKPGYLYELELAVQVHQVSTATATAAFNTHYRLRDAATSAWGAWLPLTDGGSHVVDQALIGTITVNGDKMYSDDRIGVSVTAIANAVEFGVQAPAADGWVICMGEHSYARVWEYMPT